MKLIIACILWVVTTVAVAAVPPRELQCNNASGSLECVDENARIVDDYRIVGDTPGRFSFVIARTHTLPTPISQPFFIYSDGHNSVVLFTSESSVATLEESQWHRVEDFHECHGPAERCYYR